MLEMCDVRRLLRRSAVTSRGGSGAGSLRESRFAVIGIVLATWLCFTSPAHAAYINVWGASPSDPGSGAVYRILNPAHVSPGGAGNGAAVGYADKYAQPWPGSGAFLGTRALRWDAYGVGTELGHLGTNSSGLGGGAAYAINDAGTAVGTARKYSGNTDLGERAVRWGASTTVATELGHLGTNSSGFTYSRAVFINSGGTAAGYAYKYSGNTDLGSRAVRWGASTTTAGELGNLGTSSGGVTDTVASAINDAGTVVGYAQKFDGGADRGYRAVRWDASSAAAIELGHLGTNSSGVTNSSAQAINSAGTIVGHAERYSGNTYLGMRAVRWDSTTTVATELGHLGTDSTGFTTTEVYDINEAGTAIGLAPKYSGNTLLGKRVVRWDASTTAATELGTLGIAKTRYFAYEINNAGLSVGYADTLIGDPSEPGEELRAVLWNLDGNAIDLNTLIDPASGWRLEKALGISDTNCVRGLGVFDPDGPGGQFGYYRLFLMDVSSLVPEPGSLMLLGIAVVALSRQPRSALRRRGCMATRRRRCCATPLARATKTQRT